VRKKNILNKKLTDYVTYRIIDNIIYLFQDRDISLDEMKDVFRKLALLIDNIDISYINITGSKMENNKKFYKDLGFSLSYYDVNKLNFLYEGKKNKKDYRCYGIMTKKNFFNKLNDKKSVEHKEVIGTNSGFVNNMLLLFGGIILLCYFCVQGAIYLVK